MVNVVGVLSDECVEVWENLRLDSTQMRGYCTFWNWVLRPGGEGEHDVMLVGWDIFSGKF